MNNEIINFVNTVAEPDNSLSILDDQYYIDTLKTTFNQKKDSANNIVSKAVQIAMAKGVADNVKKGIDKKVKYVVDNSDNIHKAIKNGLIKLDVRKDGKAYAQLRDANNHFGKKLPIHKELSYKGINTVELANALQTMAIEEKLTQILNVIADISTDVTRVLEGQQNDRIGLFYSGMNLYLESQNIQDKDFAKYLSAQAIKALSDANAQMIQNIQSDIRFLLAKEYQNSKSKQQLEIINERMVNINKCFEVIYRSSVLKAIVYYQQNEIPAMLTSLDEYGKFLKSVIIPNAAQLAEYDVNDIYLKDGIWETRAASFQQIHKLKYKLTTQKVYYLTQGDTK